VREWVAGLPHGSSVLVSLLGRKDYGKSEFSFYSFRGGFDKPTERPNAPSFSAWLEARYPGRFLLFEHPTVDLKPVPEGTVQAVSDLLREQLRKSLTVILFDSGGYSRTGQVCRTMGFMERPNTSDPGHRVAHRTPMREADSRL
jgi:hypothetical protein